METQAQMVQRQTARYVVNTAFNQAVLFFEDGSPLQFEHTSRKNRWAKASVEQSVADNACQLLHHFRLNAKHLQLYFKDGSTVKFTVPPPPE